MRRLGFRWRLARLATRGCCRGAALGRSCHLTQIRAFLAVKSTGDGWWLTAYGGCGSVPGVSLDRSSLFTLRVPESPPPALTCIKAEADPMIWLIIGVLLHRRVRSLSGFHQHSLARGSPQASRARHICPGHRASGGESTCLRVVMVHHVSLVNTDISSSGVELRISGRSPMSETCRSVSVGWRNPLVRRHACGGSRPELVPE